MFDTQARIAAVSSATPSPTAPSWVLQFLPMGRLGMPPLTPALLHSIVRLPSMMPAGATAWSDASIRAERNRVAIFLMAYSSVKGFMMTARRPRVPAFGRAIGPRGFPSGRKRTAVSGRRLDGA